MEFIKVSVKHDGFESIDMYNVWDDLHIKMTPEKAEELIDKLKKALNNQKEVM